MNPIVEQILAEKHRLFKKHLGITQGMVDAISNTIAPVAMFLSRAVGLGPLEDIIPGLGHLFHGHDDHPDGKRLAKELEYVSLSYTASSTDDASMIFVKVKSIKDSVMVTAPPTHKVWIHNPQAIHDQVAPGIMTHSMYVYPHTFLCHHRKAGLMSEVCEPGYVHHGLFYIEDAAAKLETLELAANKLILGDRGANAN